MTTLAEALNEALSANTNKKMLRHFKRDIISTRENTD